MPHDTILILDFGSQYTQLIARRLRELSVYCEILPYSVSARELARPGVRGVILSGGPDSVYEAGAPHCDEGVFRLGVPTLGVCYGMQLMAKTLGSEVRSAGHREYGHALVHCVNGSLLFRGVGKDIKVWASHGDRIESAPAGFHVTATTDDAPIAAFEDAQRGLYGVQFHPEVAHTERGVDILKNFAFSICGVRGDWNMESYAKEAVTTIRERVGNASVVCALSGGVDSSVAAMLVHQAVGSQLTCIFVDNGLLRKNEAAQVMDRFARKLALKVVLVDASERFLRKLKGVADPERKRKIIGREFISIFTEEAQRIPNAKFLAQGTLYPDVIESVPVRGPSQVIKSHHNVGGLPKRLKLELIEPLRELFKDEVRALGLELGIDEELLYRQPFPGPGLAIRVLGAVTRERLDLLRAADDILVAEIKSAGLYRKLWQSFGVLLPVKSVGVMGDARTYEQVLAVRAVESRDGMTADWARLPHDLLARIGSRVVAEVRGINRVVYDISSKPPSTIEWE
ncbi:MAG TPA: glutamine-hydrolyzing GMP synthase [Vicinamibacteria bacterium]|nr:glutamine-hydrolyzing GMP synthase [Vicinamibacteria bacterium]